MAAIRAGHRFSIDIRLWFDRAIVADPSLSFRDFRQARLALSRVELVRESACDASRRTLKAFLNDLAIVSVIEGEAGTLEVIRLRDMRPGTLRGGKRSPPQMKSGSRSRTNSSSETNPGSRQNRSWKRSSIRSANVPTTPSRLPFRPNLNLTRQWKNRSNS